jgi:hypothetical protein
MQDTDHVGGWQPIETAPKEVGKALLLYVPTRHKKWNPGLPLAGWWMGSFWAIFNADEAVQKVAPTHWMPLPRSPRMKNDHLTQAADEGRTG